MTRTEFFERNNCFEYLKEFCTDNNCYLMDEVVDDDSRDEWIREDIREAGMNWRGIRDWLNSIETGYEWWEYNSGDWIGLDDYEFERYQEDVADWAESHGLFDSEDEEEDDVEEEETGEELAEADFSVDELFSASISVFDELEKERVSFAVAAQLAQEEFLKEAEEKERLEQAERDAEFAGFVGTLSVVA